MNTLHFALPGIPVPILFFSAQRPSSPAPPPVSLQRFVSKIQSISPCPDNMSCKNIDPPPVSSLAAMPSEIKAAIFSYLDLADLLSMAELGGLYRDEALFALRGIKKETRERQIFAHIRCGDKRIVPFCQATASHSATLDNQTMALNIATLNEKKHGRTLLMEAIWFNHSAIVKQLLALPGIDVNAADWNNFSVLHFAALMDNEAISAQLLAQPGINIHAGNNLGSTALHCAAAFGHVSMMKLLLARQEIDANAPDNLGATALHYGALALGHEHFVESILDNKIAVIGQLLNTTGIDVNHCDNDGRTPLHFAVSEGLGPIVQRLLAAPGINANVVDNLGWTALLSALALSHTDIAVCLIELPEIDINIAQAEGWTALHYAATRGDTLLVDRLLRKPDIEINVRRDDGWTPLHCAVFNGHAQTVKRLLDEPATDIEGFDYGCNALFYAKIQRNGAIIELLKQAVKRKVRAGAARL
ncbi:ankyrin repeat domain-containing protein [Acerihabitans sp.]|uniref:ankyrin repeat domain-containing protein n=1 Tax=Acerihabitans sp. TaxID=2811394 RepID=UPI002ED9BF72